MTRIVSLGIAAIVAGCGGSDIDLWGDADGGSPPDGNPDGTTDTADDRGNDAVPDVEYGDVADAADVTEVPACTPSEECDDLDPCTARDTCNDYGICAGTAIACDNDGNDCTSEACIPGFGCHSPVDGACSDGDPCTTGDHCAEGVCTPTGGTTTWYRDDDGDGFGTADDTACQETRPDGYADQAGDCCDLSAEIAPSVGAYGEPVRCGSEWNDPEIADLNCNGIEEQRWPDAGVCENDGAGGCTLVEGWQTMGPIGSVPDCGNGAMLITECRPVPVVGCSATATWRNQTCR